MISCVSGRFSGALRRSGKEPIKSRRLRLRAGIGIGPAAGHLNFADIFVKIYKARVLSCCPEPYIIFAMYFGRTMIKKVSEGRPFAGRLLVTDMDGTLLNTKHRVSPENSAAIRRFTEGGGLFTLATGRMEKTVRPYLSGLTINAPGIIYNGAAIYDFSENRVLWRNCLPDGIEDVVRGVIGRFPGAGIQAFHGGEIYFIRENEETERHRLREGFVPIVSALDRVPKPWYKVLIAWKPEKLAVVEAWLKETGGDFRSVYSEPQFLELLNPQVSKGHALGRLVSMLGIPALKVTAMGDNLNDMEMLKEADIGIATGNAHELLKAAAGLCSRDNDGHAVAEVIGWMEDGAI